MTEELWGAVDRYICDTFIPPDVALEGAMQSSDAANLDPIAVSPVQGKFLHLLARVQGARKILEIGTLGGYSTIWLARVLPSNGRLITLEADAKHADIARVNIAKAGLADRVEVRVGRAQETLPQLVRDNVGPFDLIFIDADKTGYPEYFNWALKLAKQGTLIIADNVIRKGAVADASSTDANVQAIRKFNALVAAEPRVAASAIQTVGSKGYDGFTIAIVTTE